jgi:hypothetical protein
MIKEGCDTVPYSANRISLPFEAQTLLLEWLSFVPLVKKACLQLTGSTAHRNMPPVKGDEELSQLIH